MKNLQLHSRYQPETDKEETVLKFVANEIHLGKVNAKSGIVYGGEGRDLIIVGSRVSLFFFSITQKCHLLLILLITQIIHFKVLGKGEKERERKI